MEMNEIKPLQPLSHGSVLIVGTKQSNFDDQIKNHPRVIMWDSQNEHWTNKELPANVRAVFITRFIGHAAFGVIQREARKRHITIFNPTGTGVIARQVKELLDLNKPEPVVDAPDPTIVAPVEVKPVHKYDYNEDDVVQLSSTTQEETMTPTKGKLAILISQIDFNKTNIDNAKVLIKTEVGKTSTLASLANFVGTQRKKRGKTNPTHTVRSTTRAAVHGTETDVAVQMLDNMLKELKDMREYLVATVKENKALKARVDKLKNFLGDD